MAFQPFNPVPHLAPYNSLEDLLGREGLAEIDDLCKKVRVQWTSEPLTPNQRTSGAVMGKEIDRVPYSLSDAKYPGMKKTGANLVDVYTDPAKAVKANLAAILETKNDRGAGYFPIDMNMSDVFGTQWQFLPHTLPKVTQWAVTKGFEEILENPLPDPRESQALKWQILATNLLNQRLGDLSGFATIFALGPYYTYCSCLRGPVAAFQDIKKHPDLAVEAFDKLCVYIVDLLRYLMEAMRTPTWMLIDSLVSPTFTSPAWFEKFCAPYHRRIIKELAPIPGAIAGGGQGQTDFTPLLETFGEMGFKTFSFGDPTDLRKMKEVSNKYGVFLAHWSVTAPKMRWGTPEEIHAHVKECIRIGGPGKRYMLGTDAPDADTPLENLLAVKEAVLRYGKYPLQLDD